MFRLDNFEDILRQCGNVHAAQNWCPNPHLDTLLEFDNFESDEFRMYYFKIRKCQLNRAHDWTSCPYAHDGERARRRDPRVVPYMAKCCTNYRVTGGTCPKGDQCEYAHGVFEYWLHPTKYRTQLCHAGTKCSRSVCFFAHKLDELRSEAKIRMQKWAQVSAQRGLEAQVKMLSTMTNVTRINASNIGCGQGWGVGGQRSMSNTPNPLLLHPSSTSRTSTTIGDQRPQELQWELLEKLRMMNISDHYNNRMVRNNKCNEDYWDEPNVDWVVDLLAG